MVSLSSKIFKETKDGQSVSVVLLSVVVGNTRERM